jgi:tripartite-type tricarboxylate transporter receptor subunit TctC
MSKLLAAGPRVRFALAATVVAAAFAIAGQPGHAADYPTRSITLVVPSPPGGGTDTQARILAPKLAELLGQPVIIENRGGASGNIGAQFVAKASPDGYTLLAMILSHAINPSVLKSVPYNLDRDFAMISRTVTAPGVLVSNSSLPAKNLHELLAYMKASPGKVTFGCRHGAGSEHCFGANEVGPAARLWRDQRDARGGRSRCPDIGRSRTAWI